MKKLLLLLAFIPGIVSAASYTVPWAATSTTQGWISPLRVNGVEQTPVAQIFIATSTTATSTFANGLNLTGGCFRVNGSCLVSSSGGTVTSVSTNNGLTGGPITTSGTIGLNTTGLSTNALITWNGSNLVATGTPSLTAGYFIATSTVSTSTLPLLGINDLTSLTSAGFDIFSNSSTKVATFGAGGGSNASFFGGVNIDGQTRLATSLTGTLNGQAGVVYATATTSFTTSSAFSTTGTIGALIGGANSTIDLATNGVGLTKLAQVAANTVLGNNTGATGNVVAYATSTLGIALSDTTGTLAISRGGTNATSFSSNSIITSNESGTALSATSSNPLYATRYTATSTTVASVFPYASTTAIGSTGSAFFGTSGGSVGIGTTSPATTLSVSGNGYFTGTLGVGISSTANANVKAQFEKSTVGGGTSIAVGNPSNNNNSWAELGLYNDSGYASRAQIYLTSSAFAGTDGAGTLAYYTNTAAGQVWGTNGSEKLRLLSGGSFGIGSSTPAQKLSVAGSTYVTGGIGAGVVEGTTGRISASTGFNIPYSASTTAMRLNGTTVMSIFDGTGVGTYNTFLGYAAGNPLNNTGAQSAALGAFAMSANTTGSGNLGFGYNAMGGNTTGSGNVGIGTNALLGNTGGSRNLAIGSGASQNNVWATSTVAIGYAAGAGTAGISAQNVVAIGDAALTNIGSNSDNNTAIGYRAGYTNSNGTDNVYIGSSAGVNNTSGSRNIFIGSGADFAGSTSYYMNIGSFLYATSTTAGTAFGAFGIATTTPSARLSVKGLGTGTGRLLGFSDSSNVEKVTMLDNGNFGHGTTTPVAIIDSYTTASSTNLLLEAASGKGGCLIMKDVAGTGYTQITAQAGVLSAKVTTSLTTCN